ncbi:MAG: signal peptide peptidase SppA, partial [candidate division Zixibacteria bacterium]|nr:signal peptide peptidase SppA [candidate division Zixibacteria bacterium]
AEKYARASSSPENRRQINRILDDLYDQFVSGIAEGRGLTVDSVKGIIDNGPFTSKEALEYGLVDGLSYRDELSSSKLSPLPEVSFRKYLADTLLNDGWPERPVLAVVVADGEIAPDAGGLSPFGRGHSVRPRPMDRAFERAAVEPRVKGIIFRIDSPGGRALAAESIHRSCEKARARKPIIASMANVAASGGYHIAMSCDRLFANPASITGSIGIYGGKPDLSGLYEKIELGKELYTRGKFAGMLSWMRPFSDDEREKYRSQMKAFYDHFLALVSENRALPTDSIDILAGGRVWTGREALSNGLVDESGGLKETLDYTSERLGLEDYRIAIYPRRRPLFVLPGSSLFRAAATLILGDADGITPLSTPPVFAEGFYTRMPFDIDIE